MNKTKMFLFTASTMLAMAFTFSCSSDGDTKDPPGGGSSSSITQGNNITYGSLTDSRDNKTYRTVQIGTQTWMAENLNYNALGSKCYDNNSDNCVTYGRLYNWKMAITSCPVGWHLPNSAEWDILMAYVGGRETAGKKLKATSGWYIFLYDGNGTDEYGFSALPGGYNISSYCSDGCESKWWVARDYNYRAYYRYMNYKNDYVNSDYYDKKRLLSVRCLQDGGEGGGSSSSTTQGNGITYGSLTDSRDNKTYKTVQIGTQTWMAENLNYESEGSKCYDNNPYGCAKYGRLYDWATAMGFASNCNSSSCSEQIQAKHQGVCPNGWHISEDGDWEELLWLVDSENDGIGEDRESYGSRTAGKYLKEKQDWLYCGPYTYDPSECGEDIYGFSALPGGCGYSDGSFDYVGDYGNWWSTSEAGAFYAYYWEMGIVGVGRSTPATITPSKRVLLNVRCIKD